MSEGKIYLNLQENSLVPTPFYQSPKSIKLQESSAGILKNGNTNWWESLTWSREIVAMWNNFSINNLNMPNGSVTSSGFVQKVQNEFNNQKRPAVRFFFNYCRIIGISRLFSFQVQLTHLLQRPPVDIEFQEISYSVSDGRTRGFKTYKKILKGIDGKFRSSELCAIMGPSGIKILLVKFTGQFF